MTNSGKQREANAFNVSSNAFNVSNYIWLSPY